MRIRTLFTTTHPIAPAGPSNWLGGYKGYLQADAYGGYDGIYHKGNVTEVACWAHVRGKFFDAKETDGKRSAHMLALVGELYDVERQAKDLTQEARLELRQRESVPVLDRIKRGSTTRVESCCREAPWPGRLGIC